MRPFKSLRSLIAESKRRRVMRVIGIYGGVSFAVLEGSDIITNQLHVFVTLPFVLSWATLIGFPIAFFVGWRFDIDPDGTLVRTPSVSSEADGDTPHRYSWPVRVAAAAIVIVIVSLTARAAARIISAEISADPRGSYIITPISAGFESLRDLQVANEAGRRLGWHLGSWNSVSAVPSYALGGVRSWKGLDESEAPTLDQAYEMADSLKIGTLIGLDTDVHGDSVDLQAVMYDVRGRRQLGRAFMLTGSVQELADLVEPVAFHILGLRDQETRIEDLKSESQSIPAHRHFEDGLDALHDWRLEEAERFFRRALAEDSLFASAHHYLGLTLYWQTVRDPERILDVGHEIAHLTQAATRIAKDRKARPGLQIHMEAFNAFWHGDYDLARRNYQNIVDKIPTDTEAWLLLGSVDYHDPMLMEEAPDRFVPRRDLNAAREAFEKARELTPSWQISYGLMAGIDGQLADAVTGRGCPAFFRSTAQAPARYEMIEAGDQLTVSFCPLVDDSVVWVESESIDEGQRQRAIENMERVLVRSRNALQDWAKTYPDQARPHDELANWLTTRQSMLGCKADAAESEESASTILAERELSLGLRADTTREDLVRMAALRLATDDVDGARSLLDAALDDMEEGETAPDEAADVLLALGMPEQALTITEPTWSRNTWAINDPDTDEYLRLGDIARPVAELIMYGAMAPGPEIRGAFEALFEEWDRSRFSQNQTVHVRRALLRQGIEPALALIPDVRARWFDGWGEAGVEVPPIWRGFLAADLAAGTEGENAELQSVLDDVLDQLENETVTSLKSHYLAALLAQLAGRDSAAVEQWRLVESCPIDLQGVSRNLGLRTFGRWHLAQSYFALGDTIHAREAMAGYSALRGDGSPVWSDPTRR